MGTKYMCTSSHYSTDLTFSVSYASSVNCIERLIVCCTSSTSFIVQLCYTQSYKISKSRSGQILCAHKPFSHAGSHIVTYVHTQLATQITILSNWLIHVLSYGLWNLEGNALKGPALYKPNCTSVPIFVCFFIWKRLTTSEDEATSLQVIYKQKNINNCMNYIARNFRGSAFLKDSRIFV